MPQQTLPQVRVVDPILTSVVQGFKHTELVGNMLFPSVPVTVSGGQVLEFSKESFKIYNSRRAPGSATKRLRFGYLGKPYALSNHAVEVPVPREHLRDASVQPGIDLGTRAVNLGRRNQLLELESEQATIAIDAANYDVNHKIALAGASVWTDTVNSDPTADIETAKEQVRASIGVYPNRIVLSALAFKAAKHHPKITDRFKYTSAQSISTEMLAQLWGVQSVSVGGAVVADDAGAFSDVWGNDVVVAYAPGASAGMEEPSYGYTYTMNGHPLVETAYFDNNAKSWIYGVGYERAPVLTGITAGYLIQNAG